VMISLLIVRSPMLANKMMKMTMISVEIVPPVAEVYSGSEL